MAATDQTWVELAIVKMSDDVEFQKYVNYRLNSLRQDKSLYPDEVSITLKEALSCPWGARRTPLAKLLMERYGQHTGQSPHSSS